MLKKYMPESKIGTYMGWKEKMSNEVDQALRSGSSILFLDEVTFTKQTLKTREYSSRYSNISIDQKKIENGYYAAIAAISTSWKLEHLYLSKTAIN